MNKYPDSYKGSAKEFIKHIIIPSLPPEENILYWNNSLKRYLDDKYNLRIVRRFLSFKDRGRIYHSGIDSFTVSDNEPALWMFMNSYEKPNSSLKEIIDEKVIPVSFIKEKKTYSSPLFNYGKQTREKQFSLLGLKHCHIFDCSPKGKDLTTLSLDKRMMRLLSPMNHFPFPSTRKYKMIKDYGEDDKFRVLLVQEILKNHYTIESGKIQFTQFISDYGEVMNVMDVDDFDIEYSPKVGSYFKIEKKRKIQRIKEIDVIERKNFILSKSLDGQGKTILINSDSYSFSYNHDQVLDSVRERITSLSCWGDYGYYTKSRGIPKFINDELIVYR
jgi:hypothetical protein